MQHPDEFVAHQFHRPDLDAGSASGEASADTWDLYWVWRQSIPRRPVELLDDSGNKVEKTMTGRDLASDLVLRISQHPGSLLVRYRTAERVEGRK